MSKSATLRSSVSMRKAGHDSTGRYTLGRKGKWALGAAVVALVIGGLIVIARPAAVTQAPSAVEMVRAAAGNRPAGRLSAERAKFSFGPISMAAGRVTHRFPIKNVGKEPILISKLYTSCMCTTAALVKDGRTSDAYGMPGHAPIPTINVPINPQEEALVEVIFDPAAHGPAGVGPIERVVTIENNAGRPLELAFSALVSP